MRTETRMTLLVCVCFGRLSQGTRQQQQQHALRFSLKNNTSLNASRR